MPSLLPHGVQTNTSLGMHLASNDEGDCCFVTKSCPTLFDPMDYSPPGFSVHGIFRQEYWTKLPFPSPGDLSNPGIEPTSPALAGGFFTTEPPGKPR